MKYENLSVQGAEMHVCFHCAVQPSGAGRAGGCQLFLPNPGRHCSRQTGLPDPGCPDLPESSFQPPGSAITATGTASTRSASTSGEGYLFTRRDIVPIERLHKLQTAKGPLDQIFGVAKVIVTTVRPEMSPSAFWRKKQAEEIADSLRRRNQPDCNRTEERLWKHQLDFAIISRSSPNGWSGGLVFLWRPAGGKSLPESSRPP